MIREASEKIKALYQRADDLEDVVSWLGDGDEATTCASFMIYLEQDQLDVDDIKRLANFVIQNPDAVFIEDPSYPDAVCLLFWEDDPTAEKKIRSCIRRLTRIKKDNLEYLKEIQVC